MLWLGLQVATGKPVWDFQTNACDVLYLCLEDNFRRIQTRLFKLTDEAPDNLRFAVSAEDICHGLDEQIAEFLAQYPAIKLIIIDTLQKVRDSRSSAGKSSMYSSDYDDISAFKAIADKNNIAVVLVHHLRKQFDAKDPFNNSSGSTGLNGASDTMYILRKDSRASDSASGSNFAPSWREVKNKRIYGKRIRRKCASDSALHSAYLSCPGTIANGGR